MKRLSEYLSGVTTYKMDARKKEVITLDGYHYSMCKRVLFFELYACA